MANNNLNLTYDDFEREAKKYNLFNEFSADDLAIARQDPSAGLSLLSFKRDWHAADSPEAQEAANRGAEGIRNLWNYSGGIDGSKHYMNDTPTVTDPNYNLSWTSLTNYIPKTAPERNPEYENLYRDYLNQIINRDKFSYDAENDPNYLQYKNQYTREGNRAMQDTLGQISARSGGLASSYAGTAAQQANNYYMQQLADKIPELYQQAYNRYLKEFEMQMDTLGAIGNGRDYNLSAYNADRGAYEYDNNFRYGQIGDALNAMYTENDIKNQLAQQELENRWAEEDRARELADWYAQRGDYSYAQALGIDPSVYQKSSGGGGYYGNGNDNNDNGEYSDRFKAIASSIVDDLAHGGFNSAAINLNNSRNLLSDEEYNELLAQITAAAYESGVQLDLGRIAEMSGTGEWWKPEEDVPVDPALEAYYRKHPEARPSNK